MDLLRRIERYYDEVPRGTAASEEYGTLRLFVGTGPWPYYGRPSGRDGTLADDVAALIARQRELGMPQALEWVEEVTPGLAEAASAAGLAIHRYPLLVLARTQRASPVPGVAVRIAAADDPGIAAARAAIDVAFALGGVERSQVGIKDRDAKLHARDGSVDAFLRDLIRHGRTIMAIAESRDGPIGGGSAQPRGQVAELTGIATLPAFRRRGVGLAITAALVQELRQQGVDLMFMSAGSDDVARIYERAGFRRVAHACTAEPA
jgi:ribosomal protein S18 acetylase RimI-like enzyme